MKGRTEHVITVFVASPSDVKEERSRVEQAIAELNRTWSRELGVRLDLVRWETHAYPGFGADAQDVINEELPTDYDIFLGIMWSRYGTPTKRAGSGTEEEFKRAKARFDADSESVHLMMYFKTAPISIREIDTKQIDAIENFRSSLGSQGGLWWEFGDPDEFEKLIRLHLARQVQAWKQKSGVNLPTTSQTTTASAESSPSDGPDLEQSEMGILDLIEIYEDRVAQLTEISQRIQEATEDIGKKLIERAAEMDAAPRGTDGKPIRSNARKIIAKSADDMNQFATRMEAELPLFSTALNEGMDSIISGVELSINSGIEEEGQDIEAAITQAGILQGIFRSCSDSILGFRDVVAALPPLTSQLNQSKRRIVSVLDRFLGEMIKGEKLVHEAEISIGKANRKGDDR